MSLCAPANSLGDKGGRATRRSSNPRQIDAERARPSLQRFVRNVPLARQHADTMRIPATRLRGNPGGRTLWPATPTLVKMSSPILLVWPGSGQDVIARLLAPRLSERWRRPVVVDNRPGADGIVGVQAFAAAADHHTLLFSPAGQVTLSPCCTSGYRSIR